MLKVEETRTGRSIDEIQMEEPRQEIEIVIWGLGESEEKSREC
jgi:hypothetical protein